LWVPSGFIFAAHMCSAHVVVAGCSAQGVVHYACICCCNFFPLLLRFLAGPCKVSGLFTVITFVSLCSLRLRLIGLAHAPFLLHLWSLLTVLLNRVKVHEVTSSGGITSFSHLWCIVPRTLHPSFPLLTVNVDEGIDHILKLFRSIHSGYLILDSLIESSVVLRY